MRTYTAVQKKQPSPTVLIAHHAGGQDEHMQDCVHRLYRRGYNVILPDLFYRQPSGTERKLRSSLLKDEELLEDLTVCISRAEELGIVSSGLAVLGFCMGGRVSYLAATSLPGLAGAIVCYGGNIMQARGEGPSPFARTPGITCPVLLLSGSEDKNPSVEDVCALGEELERCGKHYEIHTYRDAGHAFQDFLTDRYNPRAASAAWSEICSFLKERL